MPVASSEYQHDKHMYCAEQINIPVTLPNILKSYAKAAIRTQPYDLLRWTAAYFRALADGELPPVKARLEYPPHIHPSGITPHFLKALLNQYCYDKDSEKQVGLTERTFTSMHVTLESLLTRWRGMALSDESLYRILMTGQLLQLPGTLGECDLYRFLAIACGLLGNNLLETMIYVCELLTHEPEGGSAMIPLKTFMKLYEYLADLDCSGSQSIIGTGTLDEGDEASLLRSSVSSSADADSNFSANGSSREKEIRGRINDISTEDTEIEESLCHFEVSSCFKNSEELACLDKAGMSRQPGKASDTKEVEVGLPAERRWNDSSRSSSGSRAATKLSSETETTRIPELESRMPSEKSTHNDKKRFERELPEGTAGELGGSASAEVTKVQEEQRRRRDVEMHSSTEKVRPVDDDETTAELQPLRLLDSPHSSSPAADSVASTSSSLGKSHVGSSEPVKAAATTGEHQRQTDKILETRFHELPKEVEAVEEARKASPSATGNVAGQGSITARNGNADRHGKNMRKKTRDKSAGRRKEKIKRKGDPQVDIPRDSFEYDDPTANNVNEVTGDKKPSWETREKAKDSSEQGERIEDKDPVDYIGEESSEENGNEMGMYYSEDEQVEDMAEYQTIGLENILEGICECREPTKETRDRTIAVSATSASPLDLVHEFIERMRAESPAGRYIQQEVPGIGPPVSSKRVTDVGIWLTDCARRQQGYVAPRNLRHFMCPNLDENTCYEDFYRTKTMCP